MLKGNSIVFYKDAKSYRASPDATFKGEPPVDIVGGNASVASDYTKKKYVFRLKYG